MSELEELRRRLIEKGVSTQMNGPNQLILATALPAWPNSSNTFWVTYLNDKYYVVTFSPNTYEVTNTSQLDELCLETLSSSKSAIYRIKDTLIEKYRLRWLSYEEADVLLDRVPWGIPEAPE